MLLEIDLLNPSYPEIKKTVDVLRLGGVIVYPTDTIYGLGCDIFDKEAIEKIYKIKNKSASGFSFICDNLTDVAKYAIVSDRAYMAMKKLLPGPYTFVFQATKLVPKLITKDKKTVAIRIPDSKICLEIVKQLGRPIVSTSVNLTNEPYFSDPLEIEKFCGNKVDLIIDAGILENEASSVIDFSSGEPIIVRRGKGDVSMFE